MLESERDRVAAAARELAAAGLVLGTAGNLSERAGDHVAVTPTGGVLAELRAGDIAVVDLDGEPVEGSLRPTSEIDLHLGIYRRFDAGAVVHVHPPMGTALACVIDELPVVHYQMLALGGSIRVAPYRTFGTPELAEATLDALEGRTAALMSNHGTIAYGADMPGAVGNAELLEWACGLYWHAAAIGRPRELKEDEQAAFISALTERSYGTLQTHEDA